MLIPSIYLAVRTLYLLLKPRKAYMNGFSLCMSCGIYTAFSVVISIYVGNIAEFMHAEYAEKFLLMQFVSMVAGFMGTFCIMLFTMNNAYRMVNAVLESGNYWVANNFIWD